LKLARKTSANIKINIEYTMKEVNYHTKYVGKIEKVLVRDDKYLG